MAMQIKLIVVVSEPSSQEQLDYQKIAWLKTIYDQEWFL